ncbi:hypothetical protein RCL1_000120 [Eukaryota sp. TZLM3-RCL]
MKLRIPRLFRRKELNNFLVVLTVSLIVIALLGGVAIFLFQGGTIFIHDAFFMAFSSVTCTGLSTVPIQTLNVVSKITLLVLIQSGSVVLWTLYPVVIRRRFLMTNFKQPIRSETVPRTLMIGYRPEDPNIPIYKLSVEYWALTYLLYLVLLYILFFYVFTFVSLTIYFLFSSWGRSVTAVEGGWAWFTFFLTISSFNNAGLTLLNASLAPFYNVPFVLIPVVIAIFAGQTGFPILLHTIISFPMKRPGFVHIQKLLKKSGREFYTHLFSPLETYWLGFWWLSFFIVQFTLLLVLDYPRFPGEFFTKILNIYFLTVATRTAGFATFDLSILSPASWTVMALLMILAPTPFIFLLRKTSRRVPVRAEQRDPHTLKGALKNVWKVQEDEPWIRGLFLQY